jgi:cytoskeleton protein RodZ
VASVPAEAIPLRQPAPPPDPTAPSPVQTPETPPVAAITPAEPEEEPEPEPAAVSGKEIALEFTGTSWVDVRGADGRVVLNGEMRSGDRRVLTGEPPFKLVIGNVAATRMTVGGQIFDLKGRSQGNVARFSLDPNVSQ